MAKNRLDTGGSEKRTASDSNLTSCPILPNESDTLVSRIKEVIGEESVSSFSRRCGFRESVLRGYLTEGKKPGVDYLVAIANAGGVTIDWLATGRLPKTRTELRAALQPKPPALPLINVGALEALIEGTLKIAPNAGASAQAAHIAKLYKQVVDDGLITPEGNGSGNLDIAC